MMTDEADSFRLLLAELASSRPDTLPRQAREFVIQQGRHLIKSNHAETVKVLAFEGHEFKCSSPHAYRRIAGLYVQAILGLNDDDDDDSVVVEGGLVKGLAHLLDASGDARLLQTCQNKLLKHKQTFRLAAMFLDLAQAAANVAVLSALSMAAALDASVLDECLQRLVSVSVTPPVFLKATQLRRVQTILQGVTVTQWNDIVSPTLQLKLKSHPDQALELLAGYLLFVQSAILTDDWMSLLLKHLTSSKERNRDLARDILIQWVSPPRNGCQLHPPAPTPPPHVVESWSILLHHLGTCQPGLAPARNTLYITLGALAAATNVKNVPSTVDVALITVVLQNLVSLVGKETLTDFRMNGISTLIQWLVVAKRRQETVAGYHEALSMVGKIVIVVGKSTVETGHVLQTLVKLVETNVLEMIVVDLWKDHAALATALEHLVETAGTKKTVQLEGLIAIYLSHIYAQGSGEQVPLFAVKPLAVGSSSKEGSFVYGANMLEAIALHPFLGAVLVHTLALYTKLSCSRSEATLTNIFPPGKASAACLAMAPCVLFPARLRSLSLSSSSSMRLHDELLECVQIILTHQPLCADHLAHALLERFNEVEEKRDKGLRQADATREAREADTAGAPPPTGSAAMAVRINTRSVRCVAAMLVPYCRDYQTLTRMVVLMHAGTSTRVEGPQRAALVVLSRQIIQDVCLPLGDYENLQKVFSLVIATLCGYIVETDEANANSSLSTPQSDNMGTKICDSLHVAALSVITSLGRVAADITAEGDMNEFDSRPQIFACELCIKHIGPCLAKGIDAALLKISMLTAEDFGIYVTPFGRLYEKSEAQIPYAPQKSSSGGKRMTEDDVWEEQTRRELAEKKGSNGLMANGKPADETAVVQQDLTRSVLRRLLDDSFIRLLSSVRCLCLSDIEVGNQCLPVVDKSVVAAVVSDCPFLGFARFARERAFKTLTSLAMCVFEIHETHAPAMAQALSLSCRTTLSDHVNLVRMPLPSPCDAAAVVLQQMDSYNDTLSGPSFAFLFPIIEASLVGPRTIPGCESSLRVLQRHTKLLAGPDRHEAVTILRKDMVVGILELLKHDRFQTFQTPTPFEALSSCFYNGNEDGEQAISLSSAELGPLLDERGALGNIFCRKAAMIALARIGSDNSKAVKNNPLIENRIWLNCHEADDSVRSTARSAWQVLSMNSDAAGLPPPSALYAAPLLPLLGHDNRLVSMSAARALAAAMQLKPTTMHRTVEMLCKAYIECVPAATSEISSAAKHSSLDPTMEAKKVMSTGLPKKKSLAPKKSPLVVTSIGTSKSKKRKPSHSALLKPKEERVLDREELESQFKSTPIQAKEDKDSAPRRAVRQGVIRTVAASTEASVEYEPETLKLLSGFLVTFGIADVDDQIKSSARDSLRELVAVYGNSEKATSFLLPLLEEVLRTGAAPEVSLGSLPSDKVPRDTSALDRRKEGAVVALGSVALHLQGPENHAKVASTIDMLIQTLNTPSEDVQHSVADALAKLMKKGDTQGRVDRIFSDLLEKCLCGDSLAVRRGAAYGISAAVKGSGIATLKKFDVVTQLEGACASGTPIAKEGSLFAIELLCSRLGLLFEPYVIVLLPSLLRSFSDSSDHVRKAASRAAGLIMSKLSAHGVKLVLPAVLTAFNDPAWRTKQASIHMLGAMSHLAPKQLASALPKIVPKLTEAFADTHPKVKGSAQEALGEISQVVKNPEISTITSVLLKALTDPAANTTKALESLIETEFLHAIDAPSLAIIIPIVHRGLRDRGARNKRFGSLIAGNICTMISDPKDFGPYLPLLVPDLQNALLDPIPDVRSTAAKALGSLSRSLGDEILPQLRPWLMKKLRDTNCSSAERSGAAQGLTEVLIASGSEVVDDVMRNEIIPLRSFPESGTREGVLWMLTFLPSAMGQGFTPLIDASLPALISGLSDDSEPVRDVAMRAGRVLIKSHGKVHVDKILPSLEIGLGDDDYRIRVSSLSLLGDLLSTIGGTTMMKGDGDTQDDIRRAERAQAQIALVLGTDARRQVLSRLYLCRNDGVHIVRQSAIQVWKTVVSVTVRTLRDIMPVLVKKVIVDLASGHPEKTEVAGRCLGDIVSKLGDTVLPQIIPLLRNALQEGDEQTKRGVCVGLSEVIRCSSREQVLKFIEIIVKLVQDALSTDSESVRSMASETFQSLYGVVGYRAFEEVVPSLMVALEKGEDGDARRRALHGLTGILAVRSRELLPYILPPLLQKPITAAHANALTGIALVTGDTLFAHFGVIIPSILFDLADSSNEAPNDREVALRAVAKAICKSVHPSGIHSLVREVAAKCASDKQSLRRECCVLLECIITEREEFGDFYDEIPIILRELLYRLNDDSDEVLRAVNGSLTALSKGVSAEELVNHIEFIRNLIATMVSEARRRKGGVGDGEFLLPGFNIPKGLDPLLPIYQRGILYGSPSIREVAAAGLGEVLAITSEKFLAGPVVIKMTGPLLRVVGDRNPGSVKVAILKTLGLILIKGGSALRAFVPQFQTTFVKALSDPSRQVRLEAIKALSLLMALSTRVDPLIKELVSGSLGKSSGEEGAAAIAVQTATLEALAAVLIDGGAKAKSRESATLALNASKELIYSNDDGIRDAAAKVVGASCALLGREATVSLLRSEFTIEKPCNNSVARHGTASAIWRIFELNTEGGLEEVAPEVKKAILSYMHDETTIVREAACVAIGAVVGRCEDPKRMLRDVTSDILQIMNNEEEPTEIHKAVAAGFCVAILMIPSHRRVDFMGIALLDACLKRALSGSQRIQFAFNDVLWLALDVKSGAAGLDQYCEATMFENARSMKSLYSKVLVKSKGITIW